MSIKPLSKETIKLINSTQVITSIYSAVKELVENSLDAQAQNIEVNLVENGLSLIEVKDNGIGISKEDAQFMGLPSYTSKIADFNDLDLLSTYGFRGEGLTAICQVSEVTVRTKTAEDEIMNCYTLDNEGHIISSEISHGLNGTTVQMKNLFKNMPVRRNILNNKKRINQEMKAVEILLKTYAICKPLIRFMFRVNGDTRFMKSNCKDVTEAVKTVMTMQIYSKLNYIEISFDKTEIQLFIPKKEIKDCTEISNANLQFLCVNDRPIRSKEIEKKINKRISDYFDLSNTHSRKYVFCSILKVESSMLDVNLEPNKDKIFLQNEASILKEIDNALLDYYGLQDSQMSTQNDIENMNVNGNLNELEKINERTKEMPATKKPKIDSTNFNVVENPDEIAKKSNDDFLNYLTAPILSDSDSNEEFKKVEGNLKEKQKLQAMDVEDINIENSQNFDFMPDFLKENQVEKIEERLSQLPVVDLGEDFNWDEIVNKCKINLDSSEKSCENESKKQKISDLAWSKGQVPGLQSGVNVAVLNHANLINFENQNDQMQDSEMFDISNGIERIGDNKLNSISNENNIKEFHWDPAKNPKTPSHKNKSTTSGTSKRKSLNDPNQTKIPFAGNNDCLPAMGPSAFAMYCAAARLKIVKDHPEYKPSEVASQLNKQWKQTSPEEREYYRNLAKQQKLNESNNLPLDSITPKKLKLHITQAEKEKNKKQLVNMLGNMKSNKAEVQNESMIMRTHVTHDISINKVAEKFKKFVTKELPSDKNKKPIVVGPLNSLLWVVNLESSLYVFDITESHAQFQVTGYDISKINAEYVESIVNRWLKEKNDLSIFHSIHSFKNTN